jgi:hypothetical protein
MRGLKFIKEDRDRFWGWCAIVLFVVIVWVGVYLVIL